MIKSSPIFQKWIQSLKNGQKVGERCSVSSVTKKHRPKPPQGITPPMFKVAKKQTQMPFVALTDEKQRELSCTDGGCVKHYTTLENSSPIRSELEFTYPLTG